MSATRVLLFSHLLLATAFILASIGCEAPGGNSFNRTMENPFDSPTPRKAYVEPPTAVLRTGLQTAYETKLSKWRANAEEVTKAKLDLLATSDLEAGEEAKARSSVERLEEDLRSAYESLDAQMKQWAGDKANELRFGGAQPDDRAVELGMSRLENAGPELPKTRSLALGLAIAERVENLIVRGVQNMLRQGQNNQLQRYFIAASSLSDIDSL